MRILLVILCVVTLCFGMNSQVTVAADIEDETGERHNWKESSTSFETIPVDTHEYTYWKNFLRVTRTCEISHKVKTVVYYCDLHDHTKSQTQMEEIIHSGKHN
ncbi:hypothetical protein GCM10027286_15610 [Virgibacillus ainsalahensis]